MERGGRVVIDRFCLFFVEDCEEEAEVRPSLSMAVGGKGHRGKREQREPNRKRKRGKISPLDLRAQPRAFPGGTTDCKYVYVRKLLGFISLWTKAPHGVTHMSKVSFFCQHHFCISPVLKRT